MFEVFEHTADLGLRIRAATLEELFREAGRAFFSLVAANPDQIRAVDSVQVEVAAEDLDYLFFDWLNELLFLVETERLLVADFDVTLEGVSLRAECRGEAIDESRHDLHHEVKAITYHQLRVVEDEEGWLAEVILDI